MAGRRSSLQPGQRRYTMAQFGEVEDERGLKGNFFLRKDVAELRKAVYMGNDPHTVLRALPVPGIEDPNAWEPTRLSRDRRAFGDWIRVYTMALGVGKPACSYICFDPATDPTYDLESNPLQMIYKACKQAIDDEVCRPDWPKLLISGTHGYPILKRPEPSALTQSFIYKLGEKNYGETPLGSRANDKLVIFQYGKSASQALSTALEEPVPDDSQIPEDADPADFFLAGKVVELNSGKFIHVMKRGFDPSARQQASGHRQERRRATIGAVVDAEKEKEAGGGYDVQLTDSFGDFGPELDTAEAFIRTRVRAWDDILLFTTHKEQVEILVGRLPNELILYTFRDFPEYLPDKDSPAGMLLRGAVTGQSAAIPSEPEATTAAPVTAPASQGGVVARRRATVGAAGGGETAAPQTNGRAGHKADTVIDSATFPEPAAATEAVPESTRTQAQLSAKEAMSQKILEIKAKMAAKAAKK